jgi:hypothetical protein
MSFIELKTPCLEYWGIHLCVQTRKGRSLVVQFDGRFIIEDTRGFDLKVRKLFIEKGVFAGSLLCDLKPF